ncbi:hypothetical protein SAMN05421878_10161 [Actinobaculum suis]|uniref:Cell division protein FtsL n=1 Tax=Actinobaculum suis TaxID=1657 RepID=A0A0K9EVA6_9ACTO|nr:hypothetical protein [Actinobaculum suis]KMY23821.1 hypothetical protein ACU19_02180 [Actinobaculum suis]MDY5153886.1 hypothetical protein [Actinobaculum suis]OCA93314.1 hypothetical protein ACU20_02060 [Actinobaculum suis]OCA94467.1 hypothetical protein ACU21_07135 [Actinobaculum suis]SDE00251.1 hypothetical protein SAMN05421878_10161 [Actinobaculum suis]
MSQAVRRLETEARPEPRRVIDGKPHLTVVPTPTASRGFGWTIAICALLFIGSLITVFSLNTAMVGTAYEIRSVQQGIAEESAHEATLRDQVVAASTPGGLLERAKELGLEPAPNVQHIDLAQGRVITPHTNTP